MQYNYRKLHCLLLRNTVSNGPLRPLPPTNGTSQGALRPQLAVTVIEELCKLYIKHIHDDPHALFHEPTLRRDVASGTIPDATLYCIIGLSAGDKY